MGKSFKKSISIVIPAYNEEKKLSRTLKELKNFLEKRDDVKEIIFVNDGSTDNTEKILLEESRKNSWLRVVSYPINKGKGFAIKKGMLSSVGDVVAFTDADLAYSFSNLEEALRESDNHDVVIGSRKLAGDKSVNRQKFFRKIAGKSYSFIINALLNHKIIDTQCGLKVFNRNAVKEIFTLQRINGFAFDTEILVIARFKGFKIKEIPAMLDKDHLNGRSSVNLLTDSVKMFVDVLKIKYNLARGAYGKKNLS